MRASLSCNARPRMWEPGALLDRQDEETKTPMSCNAWPITWECLASLSERLNESITLSRNAQPRVWGLEAEGFRLSVALHCHCAEYDPSLSIHPSALRQM
eukprot:scaffold68044_cov24-Tisochrysis_lutea.AAC.3